MQVDNIFVIGCGGIGSNLAKPLAKFLKYHIINTNRKTPLKFYIVDGDFVEDKNLQRQSFIQTDIGQNKAVVTSEDLSSSVPIETVQYLPIPSYLKEENLDFIVENSIVLVGVDNYITRRIIESYTEKLNNIAVIFGGNEYHDGDVNVLIRRNGVLVTPLLSEKHPEILKKDRFPDEVGCAEAQKSAPQIIPTNLTVATIMLNAAFALLTTGEVKWHETFFDIKTGDYRVVV